MRQRGVRPLTWASPNSGSYAGLDQLPANGLSPIWKQPIGLGFASFAIADGRVNTIEQRRGQEVVAAYDIGTGRELWKQAWKEIFPSQIFTIASKSALTCHHIQKAPAV